MATDKPFDGMREHREKPLYQHTPLGVGYVMAGPQHAANALTAELLDRTKRIDDLATILAEVVGRDDEDIVYDAVDELRRRWAEARVYEGPEGFGLAPLKAEGAKVPVDARLPSYREAIADRDEFGKRAIALRRRLRKVKQRLRRLRRSLR